MDKMLLSKDLSNSFTAEITPMGKPRMTRSDSWRNRDCVNRYYSFKDELSLIFSQSGFELCPSISMFFYLPMPKSWSKKKKEAMNNSPHQQKPDIDNLIKAVLDSLYKDDSHFYDVHGVKYWAETGRIIFVNRLSSDKNNGK